MNAINITATPQAAWAIANGDASKSSKRHRSQSIKDFQKDSCRAYASGHYSYRSFKAGNRSTIFAFLAVLDHIF